MATWKGIIRGRVERAEFKEPFGQCVSLLKSVGVPFLVNPRDGNEPADFFIFFQSYPHEFPAFKWKNLRRFHPFAPCFFVLGVCCEGMLRTAQRLDSPFYCYAHGEIDWELEQLSRFLSDQPSLFSLPATTENDEIVLWAHPIDLRQKEKDLEKLGKNCLILTQFGAFGNDSAMNRLIADEQKQQGYKPIFWRDRTKSFLPLPVPIIADADDSPAEKILNSIQRLRQQFADNEFTVYIDSPRINEKNAYRRAGVTRILPKGR